MKRTTSDTISATLAATCVGLTILVLVLYWTVGGAS